MTPREQRGQRLFLILAILIILPKLVGIASAFSGGLGNVQWFIRVFQPMCLVFSVAFLWQGDIWMQRAVSAICILVGTVQVAFSVQILVQLAWRTPPSATWFYLQVIGIPVGFLLLIGLLTAIIGILFYFSPSLNAFFTHQRVKRQRWAELERYFAPHLANEPDSDTDDANPTAS